MSKDSIRANPKAIARIVVDRLFGAYSYVLPPPEVDSARLSSLMLLYGDNGSGKTTILRTLYSLLSSALSSGFKTSLAKTPFASFSVTLGDGTTLGAFRVPGELIGSFELNLTRPNEPTKKIFLRANSDNVIKVEGDEEREYFEFLSHVRSLGIALYFLSDDRKLQKLHAVDEDENVDDHFDVSYSRAVKQYVLTHAALEAGPRRRDAKGLSLESSVEAFTSWTRQQALRASNVGEGNTNTIYTDLIRRISFAYDPGFQQGAENGLESIRTRLLAIEARGHSFVELGLISQPPVHELVSEMSSIDSRSLPIVRRVLEPYVEALEARLNALQQLQDVLTTFISNINDLYSGKHVSYTLQHGLRINSPNGSELRPEFLSSGEKQLLVLLCNTALARDQTSIFVIDEPELSLNVKWQRKLVRTLLEGVIGSDVQFILATHSIELLSAYHDNVVKLEAEEWRSSSAQQLVS